MPATTKEHIPIQRRLYHHLLSIKEDPKQLDYLINLVKTEMDIEDAAYVEKQIREQYGK